MESSLGTLKKVVTLEMAVVSSRHLQRAAAADETALLG